MHVGQRPFFMIDGMPESDLKTKLNKCRNKPIKKSDFSIAHRGVPLSFPEHTEEGYRAAALSGAGVIECDVTFTLDRELVCRHGECDLATTTNILLTDLAAKCETQFAPGVAPKCCASALTLAEFKSLQGKMDDSNSAAQTVEEYVKSTNTLRTDMHATRGTLMTHKESIALFQELKVKMTPELKGPDSAMPEDFSRDAFIAKAVAEYADAGVEAEDVFIQSFLWTDVEKLLLTQYASQTTFLDSRTYNEPGFAASEADMQLKYDAGLRFIAPAVNGLVGLDTEGNLMETDYSIFAKGAGLQTIAWSMERSAWYYNTVGVYGTDERYYELIHFLAQVVKPAGLFSDYPGTTSYYANCFGIGQRWHRRSSRKGGDVGQRPFFMIDGMPESDLKTKLNKCRNKPIRKSDFSIAHRGVPLSFPEHTEEGYRAAAGSGAGVIECDVTFTLDRELVCRHGECDLATTTNILLTDLAAKCETQFAPGVAPKCCASALTLAEFKSLQGKMDDSNSAAQTVEEYVKSTNTFRTDMHATRGTLMTHKESIALFQELKVKMTPELKGPDSAMPEDFSRDAFIAKAVAEYADAGVCADDVFIQSFLWTDVEKLLLTQYASQTTFLDSRTYNEPGFAASEADMQLKYDAGLRFIAPAVNGLVGLDTEGNLMETDYSIFAKGAGLQTIGWSMERSAWYYNTVGVYGTDERYYELIHFLAQVVKPAGLFSDYPGTTSYYANCFGIGQKRRGWGHWGH